jgi:hypothetical protein
LQIFFRRSNPLYGPEFLLHTPIMPI